LIEVSHLTKVYGDLTAVKDLNLEINEGEIFGLVGPNGAGKTTIVRMICGAISPTSGTVKINGIGMGERPSEAKALIGYLPEEPNLYERLTPRRLLGFFADLYGERVSKERIDELLQMVRLRERADFRIGTFSKGMRQRLAIARALVHEPEVLILDEPTMGLDPGAAKFIRDFIEEHRERKTILLCTHYMYEADELCERIGILNRGELVALGGPKALKAEVRDNMGKAELPTLDEVFLYFTREFRGGGE